MMKKKELDKFQIVRVTQKRAWAYCQWHDDQENPNLSITLQGEYRGRYRCFACGKYGQLSEQELAYLNLDYTKPGYDMKEKKKEPDLWHLQQKYQNECTLHQIKPLCEAWGVLPSSLYDYGCGWDGKAYTFPMYSHKELVGIQRRFLDGGKLNVEGTAGGVFRPGFHIMKEDFLIITEGVSDAVAVHDLGYNHVIGRQSCTFDDKEIFDSYLKDVSDPEAVVIISDNDDPGIKGANTFLNNLDHDNACIFVPPEKDVREWIAKSGRINVRVELDILIDDMLGLSGEF